MDVNRALSVTTPIWYGSACSNQNRTRPEPSWLWQPLLAIIRLASIQLVLMLLMFPMFRGEVLGISALQVESSQGVRGSGWDGMGWIFTPGVESNLREAYAARSTVHRHYHINGVLPAGLQLALAGLIPGVTPPGCRAQS